MLKASKCTLYHGGHVGTETFFGQCAEKWGLKEVTYSFKGHFIKRDKNVVMLGKKELKQGDVSMEIISQHMHRKYAKSDKIKAIFQSIYHIVNKGSQIFAVGIILEDNTVKGGTGWGVELGKFFNRNINVFDKNTKKWHTWRHDKWVRTEPVVLETTLCGTGTRDLDDTSKKAIEELFTRSFGVAG
jgi:hypothetical protein